MTDIPDIMRAQYRQQSDSHTEALRYRREQWRHEARLEFAKLFIANDLREGGKIDANTIIETSDALALAMYPEPE